MATVKPDQLAAEIEKELGLYSKGVTEKIKKQAKSSMSDLVKQTKATAPVGKRTKHYRDSITSRKERETANGVSYLWYVKGSDYRLSHLLNNGHVLRNGGRYSGTQFIGNAEKSIIADFEKKVEEIIRNG